MTLKLQMECDNAAFDSDGAEVGRILHRLADSIEEYGLDYHECLRPSAGGGRAGRFIRMVSSIDVRKYHALYEAADAMTKQAIDFAYDKATAVLLEYAIDISQDDAAEELVAALMHYVMQCRKAQHATD